MLIVVVTTSELEPDACGYLCVKYRTMCFDE